MVEVVGTAPTSAMFITKFVYRRSWKSNINNIKLYFRDSIDLLKMTLSEQQKKEIAEQQAQKNTTKRVISPELEKILLFPVYYLWIAQQGFLLMAYKILYLKLNILPSIH